MHQITFAAMGCQITASLDTQQTQNKLLLDQIPVWFKQWELSFSLANPDSEISLINASNGQAVRVSRTFWSVLRIAIDVADRSEGFVSLLATRRASPLDWRTIQLDPFTSSVRLPRGAILDFTNIARSWAANIAVQRFAEYGPTMLDTQDEVVVSGPMADGTPWQTALANSPISQKQLGYVMLGSGAAATFNRKCVKHSQESPHEPEALIDPRTNKPSRTDLVSATVIAPDGPTANMAARIVLILGSQAGLPWIEARPHLAALLLNEKGAVITTRKMTNRHYQRAHQLGA
jgi:thiamine biosynthesis lipoprotein